MTMKFQYRGKSVQVTDALKEYVEKRLTNLINILTIALNYRHPRSRKDRRVEVTCLNGYILRGEESSIWHAYRPGC